MNLAVKKMLINQMLKLKIKKQRTKMVENFKQVKINKIKNQVKFLILVI